ncbi:flagellar basal body P-ring protein FlgI [Thiomicrorhabdus sp. ZW0627]|uniref:flagellar basal body P-ring protein FlgI n=1 Tax=Thiomicrorhabdus sp. ZW0627 TaxID=3039774 RepID=UPI00243737E4|nr:flagellar basal body P-ring protein FlgI [Thiomicrorhabdus sp. ZW0627]MDG6773371.1 flagellar basal body P-ring protein FlgI [Thiomicrorhabdus sp. ZW0627]
MLTRKLVIFLTLLLMWSTQSFAERVKDLANVGGVRSNQLVGYGLVVGLNGSGDKTPFAEQSLLSMLNKFGIHVPAGVKTNAKNIAAVAVHADLPAFAKQGQKIDVTVSSLGNAKSLRGGTLLLTPLKGVDGNVYALAQGNLVVGGLDASGADGSRITINIPSVGRVPGGASVEKTVNTGFDLGNTITLNLKDADFTTATNMVNSINKLLGEGTASAIDGESIEVMAPRLPNQRVAFLSVLENIDVTPGEEAAKVIVNSRTGTVVIGQNVRVSPAAVTHGGLVVKIGEQNAVSQPNPFAGGTTAVTPQSNVAVGSTGSGRMFEFPEGVSLNDIVQAVNKVGAAPGDLVAILEALKQAGSLKAELMII